MTTEAAITLALMVLGLVIVAVGLVLMLNVSGIADAQSRQYKDGEGIFYQLRRPAWWPMSAVADVLMGSARGWRLTGAFYFVIGLTVWLVAILLGRASGS